MTKSVAIVGFGPSAMYSIIACNELGIYPTVYSYNFNIQPGAFWLKWLPESVAPEFNQFDVTIKSIGTREEYIRKQWGSDYPKNYKSSFPDVEFIEKAYDPSDVMLRVFSEAIFNTVVLTEIYLDSDLITLGSSHDFVFHTFPSYSNLKAFKEDGVIIKVPTVSYDFETPKSMVVYNGLTVTPVVRTSFLYGRKMLELSSTSNIPYIRESTEAKFSSFFDIAPVDELEAVPFLAPNVIPLGRLADRRAHV